MRFKEAWRYVAVRRYVRHSTYLAAVQGARYGCCKVYRHMGKDAVGLLQHMAACGGDASKHDSPPTDRHRHRPSGSTHKSQVTSHTTDRHRHRPSQTITDHHRPSQTITDHHRQLTITDTGRQAQVAAPVRVRRVDLDGATSGGVHLTPASRVCRVTCEAARGERKAQPQRGVLRAACCAVLCCACAPLWAHSVTRPHGSERLAWPV